MGGVQGEDVLKRSVTMRLQSLKINPTLVWLQFFLLSRDSKPGRRRRQARPEGGMLRTGETMLEYG